MSAIPAAYLLCSTAIRRDIRAALYFCSCDLRWRSTECVLLSCFNALPDMFCSYELVCLSVECCDLLRSPNLGALICSSQWHIVQQRVRSACRIICMLCQQTSPKRWLVNVNMTSYYNVKNSVHPVTITTIRHCSILEFGWEAYNQAVTPDITRPLHATDDDIKQTKGYYCLNEHNCFESRYCFTSPSYDHLLYVTKLWSLAQWPACAAQQLGSCLCNFAVRECSMIILK